jgi:hypothetical protein
VTPPAIWPWSTRVCIVSSSFLSRSTENPAASGLAAGSGGAAAAALAAARPSSPAKAPAVRLNTAFMASNPVIPDAA